MAKANMEDRRSSILANSIQVDMDHRPALVDKVGKVGTTMAEHRPADTASKQAMEVQRRVTTAAQEITTTTSTIRYVLQHL